jgi:hypothetical protein
MRPKFSALSFLTVLILFTLVSCTSNHGSPLSASKTGQNGSGQASLPTYTLFKNGVYGPWFGKSLINENAGSATMVAVTDSITGDPTVMLVTVNCNPISPPCISWGNTPWVKLLTCPATTPIGTCPNEVATDSYASQGGKIEFNIMLGVPPSEVNGLYVRYGQESQVPHNKAVTATLSNSAWTHVSLPMSSFSSSAATTSDMAFSLTLIRQVPGSSSNGFYLNDIKWTQ